MLCRRLSRFSVISPRRAQHGAVQFRQVACAAICLGINRGNIRIGNTEILPDFQMVAVLIRAFGQVADLQDCQFPKARIQRAAVSDVMAQAP